MGLTSRLRLALKALRGQPVDSSAAQVPRWTSALGLPAPESTDSDRSRYATSDDVYAAVSLLADNAATVPLLARPDGGDPDPEADLSLLLRRPNRRLGATTFWVSVYSHLLLTGECYLWIGRTNPVDRAMPNELMPWPGHLVNIEPDRDSGGVAAYRFNRTGLWSEAERVDPADVVALTLWNPYNPYRGMSPLRSLALGLDSEREAKSANRDLFRNGAMIDGAISVKGPLTADQREQARQELRARHVGTGKRHQMLFLEGGEASFVPMRITPRDLEFIELDKLTTRDVCKAFRVPPPYLADLERATYSNMEQCEDMLWTLGILPRVQMVASQLTAQLAWQFGADLEVAAETAGISALQEDRQQQAATLSSLVAAQVSLPVAWETAFGEPLPDGAAPEALPPAAPPGTPQAEPNGVQAGRGFQFSPARLAVVTSHTRALSAASIYAQIDRQRERIAPDLRAGIRAGFEQAGDILLARFDAAFGSRALVDDIVFALRPTDDEAIWPVEQALWRGLVNAGLTGAETGQRLFGLTFDFDRVTEDVKSWSKLTAAQDVTYVTDTTIKLLRDGIATALDTGGGLAGVRQVIQAAFRGSGEPDEEFRYADRVENIAQTELARGFGYGNLAGMIDAGVEKTEWLHSGLPISRHGPEEHKGNGQVKPPGELFSLDGYPARYPADPMLPIQHAARCKCVVVPTEVTA